MPDIKWMVLAAAVLGTAVLGALVTQRVRQRRLAFLIMATLVALVGWRLWPPCCPDPDVMPECPHDWRDVEGFPSDGRLAIAGVNTSVPEYHDCQRFLVDAGESFRFGDLQAVFVREQLDVVYADPTRGGLIEPGNMIRSTPLAGTNTQVPSRLLVIPDASGLPMVLPPGSRLLTIGTIYSEGPYPELGISARFQCIILLWRGGMSAATYDAWVVPVGSEESCVRPEDLLSPVNGPPPPRTRLGVAVIPPQQGDRIPPVARWDWDAEARLHYIGIACPTGWCELYAREPHHSSAPLAAPAFLQGAQGQVARVKGWYDEQLLAHTVDWRARGVDGVRGTVVPVPELGARVRADYLNKFTPVAWVALDRVSEGYRSKANFGRSITDPLPTVGLEQRTELALCYMVQGGPGCRTADGSTFVKPAPKRHISDVCPSDDGGTWYARITAPDGQVKDVCVIRRKHEGAQPPPVARWRWSARDDLVWISCPLGCCEVELDNQF